MRTSKGFCEWALSDYCFNTSLTMHNNGSQQWVYTGHAAYHQHEPHRQSLLWAGRGTSVWKDLQDAASATNFAAVMAVCLITRIEKTNRGYDTECNMAARR